MPYDISVNSLSLSLSFLSMPCHGPCLFVGILRICLKLLKMLSPTWHIIVMLKWERKADIFLFDCLICYRLKKKFQMLKYRGGESYMTP